MKSIQIKSASIRTLPKLSWPPPHQPHFILNTSEELYSNQQKTLFLEFLEWVSPPHPHPLSLENIQPQATKIHQTNQIWVNNPPPILWKISNLYEITYFKGFDLDQQPIEVNVKTRQEKKVDLTFWILVRPTTPFGQCQNTSIFSPRFLS